MKLASICMFQFFLITAVSTAQAGTITSIGMSEKAGGYSFNKDLATASANALLAEQASVTTFRYDRKKGNTVVESTLKSELRNVKTIRVENIGKGGALVWMKADIETPQFADERCIDVKESLDGGEKNDRITRGLLIDNIPDLLQTSLKNAKVVTGVGYLRNLAIKKNWFGKFKLKTQVCVAQLKLMSEAQ